MNEKYSASTIANYFIERCTAEHVTGMTQMKIQKLVYLAQGFSLALFNADILGGEDVAAWKHGPVIPSLYHSLKSYGNSVVNELITETYEEFDGGGAVIPKIDSGDDETRATLDIIWRLYKNKTAAELRNLTHEKNTPWALSYCDGERNTVIPRYRIKGFYDVLFEKIT